MRARSFAAVVAALLSISTLAAAPLSIDDLAKIREVRDPQISPDGNWIAYVLGTTDAEKDKHDSDLFMVSWDGTQRIQLTSTPESSERAPRWSPDNRYLAFLASRGTEEEKKKGTQLWLLDRRGGEAVKLTDIAGGISDYAWSPDAHRLVLVVNDFDPNSQPEKKEGWKRKTKPPIVVDRYHFKQDREGYLGALHTHLQLFDVESKKSEVLTSGNFDEENPVWSPDGKWIAFVSNHEKDPDRAENQDIFVIEARPGAEARKLTAFSGPDWRPAWSPNGRFIAYLQGDEPKYSAYQMAKLAVVPAAGGEPRVLTAALDRAVQAPLVWSADGSALTFVVQDDRTTYLGRMPAIGGRVEALTSGSRVVSSITSTPAGRIALLGATDAQPFEVEAFDGGALRPLSHENDDWLANVQLANVRDFSCRGKDGTEIHGLLFEPPGHAAGTRLPMLLNIHGGPNGQDQHAFSFERQFLAANGYAVLAVNYRGSAGRGAAYQKAIFADWGDKEVKDLLAAVDWAIASGIADPARLGIGGWSYGGILTDYTIASDGRFKGAVAGAGSALQTSMYGVDQYVAQYDLELGPPWKNFEPWIRVSYPFLHADRIHTPTLFLGGQSDFNVPVAGGEQMYEALRSIGIDTELVVYPGQFHGITMPSYARDRLQRYVAWYDKHVKGSGK